MKFLALTVIWLTAIAFAECMAANWRLTWSRKNRNRPFPVRNEGGHWLNLYLA